MVDDNSSNDKALLKDYLASGPHGQKSPEPEPPEAPYLNAPVDKFRGLRRQTVRYFIDKRRIDTQNNPQLIIDYRWDQSDVFYNTRKLLDGKGYDISDLSKDRTRKDIYRYIKTYCEKIGIKRHDIGIFPADRAVMAYQGKEYSVNYENYNELANKGVDIVCIEKEGIVDKSSPFTEGVGIALVQSQGFVSEYGQMLVNEAELKGANVMMATDFDAEGIGMAFSIDGITRLGVDFDTIEEINALIEIEKEAGDFPHVGQDESVYIPDMDNLEPKNIEKLDIEELAEERDVSDYWTMLKNLTQGLRRKDLEDSRLFPIEGTEHEKKYIEYLNQKHYFKGQEITNLEFLKHNRIELNTILNAIGPKRFWNWLYSKIVKTFPTRDYNRVIAVPPYTITLPALDRLNSMVEGMIDRSIEDETNTITDELYNVNGLLDTNAKTEEIHDTLSDVVNEDEDIEKLSKKIEELIISHYQDEDNTD